MAATPASRRTDLKLDKHRRALDAERQRLEAEIRNLSANDEGGGATGELGELGNRDQQPGDVGTELFLREQDMAIVQSLRHELDQVDVAFKKLDNGTYGICDRCDANIPAGRLDALPYASLCVKCAGEISA